MKYFFCVCVKTPQITPNTFVWCNQLQLLQQSNADLGQRSL